MNIEFEKAIQYIDLGNYTKAVDCLNSAIEAEAAAGNDDVATEYRCVLGELYAQLDMEEQAIKEFTAVKEYCDSEQKLKKQNDIAAKFLTAYQTGTIEQLLNGGLNADGAKKAAKPQRPGYVPLIPKPVQDKSFISKQMSKKRR